MFSGFEKGDCKEIEVCKFGYGPVGPYGYHKRSAQPHGYAVPECEKVGFIFDIVPGNYEFVPNLFKISQSYNFFWLAKNLEDRASDFLQSGTELWTGKYFV